MTDIKRFDLGTDNTHYYGVPVIEECEDGDYVLSAAYDALKEERDQLRAELNAAAPKPPVQEPVATVIQSAPYEDGSINPCKSLQWSGNNAEDDLAVGTKLYAAPQPPVHGYVARVDDLERGGRVRALALGLSLDAPLYAAPQPSDDAKDAARYRWLRERGDACQWENILRFDLEEFVCADNALDAAIDAAMAGGGE